MNDRLRIILKTLVFFILPGAVLLLFDYQSWWQNGEDLLFVLVTLISRPIGLLLIAIGVIFFAVSLNKSKRKRIENAARKKVDAIGKDIALSYERTEPLTESDIRFINRQIYGMIVVLGLFCCVPLIFLFFIDESQRVYIYTFMSMWVCVVGLIGGQTYTNYARIRNGGEKTVLKGIITDRFNKYRTERVNNEDSTTLIPCLRIGDIELEVTITMQRRYNLGDAVEFHYAPTYFFGRKRHNIYFTQTRIEGAGVLGDVNNPEVR